MSGYPQQQPQHGHYDDGYDHGQGYGHDSYYQDDGNQGYYEQGQHGHHNADGYYDEA